MPGRRHRRTRRHWDTGDRRCRRRLNLAYEESAKSSYSDAAEERRNKTNRLTPTNKINQLRNPLLGRGTQSTCQLADFLSTVLSRDLQDVRVGQLFPTTPDTTAAPVEKLAQYRTLHVVVTLDQQQSRPPAEAITES